jgi:hypothetical protein
LWAGSCSPTSIAPMTVPGTLPKATLVPASINSASAMSCAACAEVGGPAGRLRVAWRACQDQMHVTRTKTFWA